MQIYANAQNARTSIDFTVGPTFALTSIPSGISGGGGIGIKYNWTKTLAFGFSVDVGNIRGSQNVPYIIGPSLPKQFNAYTNNFELYNANIQINLNHMLHLRSIMKRVNPYLVFGAGINNSDVKTYLVDGRVKHFVMNFNNASAGIVFRYFYNPQFDLKFGMNINYTQSHYLDGIPTDGKDDYFILTSIGVAYKIGATRSNPHIEWEDVIAEYKEPVKKIKQPKLPREHKQKDYKKDVLALINKIFKADSSKVNKSEDLLANKPIGDTANNISGDVVAKNTQKPLEEPAKTDTSNIFVGDTSHSVTVGVMEDPNSKPEQDKSFRVPPTETLTGVLPISALNELNEERKPKGKISAKSNSVQNANTPTIEPPIVSSGTKLATAPRQTYKPSNGILAPEINEEKPVVYSAKQKKINSKINSPEENSQPIASVVDKRKETEIEQGISDTNAPVIIPSIPVHQIIEPIATYNVIVGSYISKKYAIRFNSKLRKMGYESLIFKSHPHSRLLRVSIYSGKQRHAAVIQMLIARKKIDKGAWLHVYRQRN